MITILFLRLLSLLPLKLLYLISNILSFFLHKILKYRINIVNKNLNLSKDFFPDTNLKLLRKKFYIYFSDLYLEVIKMRNLNENFFLNHFEIKNIKPVEKFLSEGKSVMLLLSHYSGYEWCTALPYFLKFNIVSLYTPLKNKKINDFIITSRTKHGISLLSRYTALRDILKIEKNKTPTLYGFVADQSPSLNSSKIFWTKFLNQEVPVFTGPEIIAKKFNMPVFYAKMTKTSRGHYKIDFELITSNSSTEKEFYITKKYLNLVEEQIVNDPSLYLWTHNRFKHAKN